jgi:hypothetical protein
MIGVGFDKGIVIVLPHVVSPLLNSVAFFSFTDPFLNHFLLCFVASAPLDRFVEHDACIATCSR